MTFPAHVACPKCTATEMEVVELAARGTLWTWTIQAFPPKSPPYARDEPAEEFQPFAVGYVELPEGVRVEARLTTADPDMLEIDMPMELVFVPFSTDEDGTEVLTYAFQPVEEQS